MKALFSMAFICYCYMANAQAKPRHDTINLVIPKDNRFDPSSPKLRNSKIKTPLYNNALKGTNAPGDPNTGLPADNTDRHPIKNSALEKVKAMKDSTATVPNN